MPYERNEDGPIYGDGSKKPRVRQIVTSWNGAGTEDSVRDRRLPCSKQRIEKSWRWVRPVSWDVCGKSPEQALGSNPS